MSTRVIHKRDATGAPGEVYIGRPSKWGNPYKIGRDGTRAEVIAAFTRHGIHEGLDREARRELRGKTLVCWCSPQPCHGDVLARWADAEPSS